MYFIVVCVCVCVFHTPVSYTHLDVYKRQAFQKYTTSMYYYMFIILLYIYFTILLYIIIIYVLWERKQERGNHLCCDVMKAANL